jgi:hypothetical protein
MTATGPLGYQRGPQDISVKNVTAATSFPVGRVVQLDLAVIDADTLNLKFGVNGSGYNHVILPQAGLLGITGRLSIFGVCQEVIAAGATGRVRLYGQTRVLALSSGAASAWVRGQEGIVTAAGVIDFRSSTPTVVGRLVARAEEAKNSGVEILAQVWFEGASPAFRNAADT